MLSRVANSVYWMSRYVERAENVARFIDVNAHLALDLPVEDDQQWEPLIITTGDHQAYLKRHDRFTRDQVIHFLTSDGENPNSILSCLVAAREAARSIREVISPEMWKQLNTFYLMVSEAARNGPAPGDLHGYLDAVKFASQLFTGITDSTMTHGEGWHFGRVGRMLERADKTSRILDVKYFILLPSVADVGTPYDNIQWAALLRSASGFEMYRQRFGRLSPDRVVEFLLLDRDFPRSARHCLNQASLSLHQITGSPPGTFANPAERHMGRLCGEFDYTPIEQIIAGGLHEFVDGFQTRLNRLGEAIHDTFFALRTIDDSPLIAHGANVPR